MGVFGYVERIGSRGRHERCGQAVVQLHLVRDVAQGVHMGVAVAMELHTYEIRRKAQAARTDVVIVAGRHVVDSRVRVIGPCDLVDGKRERDRPTRADK